VDAAFHRQEDEREPDRADHEAIDARAKLKDQDGHSEHGPGDEKAASAEVVPIHVGKDTGIEVDVPSLAA